MLACCMHNPANKGKLLKVINFLQKDLIYKQYHGLVIEAFIELTISVYFMFRYFSAGSPGDFISIIISAFTLLGVFI